MSKAGITVQKRSTKKNAHFFRKSAPRFASSRLRLAIPLRVYSNKYARAPVKILAALAALDVQVSLTSDESMKRLPIGILDQEGEAIAARSLSVSAQAIWRQKHVL